MMIMRVLSSVIRPLPVPEALGKYAKSGSTCWFLFYKEKNHEPIDSATCKTLSLTTISGTLPKKQNHLSLRPKKWIPPPQHTKKFLCSYAWHVNPTALGPHVKDNVPTCNCGGDPSKKERPKKWTLLTISKVHRPSLTLNEFFGVYFSGESVVECFFGIAEEMSPFLSKSRCRHTAFNLFHAHVHACYPARPNSVKLYLSRNWCRHQHLWITVAQVHNSHEPATLDPGNPRRPGEEPETTILLITARWSDADLSMWRSGTRRPVTVWFSDRAGERNGRVVTVRVHVKKKRQ